MTAAAATSGFFQDGSIDGRLARVEDAVAGRVHVEGFGNDVAAAAAQTSDCASGTWISTLASATWSKSRPAREMTSSVP